MLTPDEWPRLGDIMRGREEHVPSPQCSVAAIAEDAEGKIQGVWFLQMAFHMEPLVLNSPHINFLRLHETLEDSLAERKGLTYYAFSDIPLVERMAAKVGMTRLPFNAVWQKEIR